MTKNIEFESAGPVPQEAESHSRRIDFASAGILNLGSEVSWSDMPVPHRWHLCRADNRFFQAGTFVSRCACGNIAIDGHWMHEKNSRRKSQKS